MLYTCNTCRPRCSTTRRSCAAATLRPTRPPRKGLFSPSARRISSLLPTRATGSFAGTERFFFIFPPFFSTISVLVYYVCPHITICVSAYYMQRAGRSLLLLNRSLYCCYTGICAAAYSSTSVLVPPCVGIRLYVCSHTTGSGRVRLNCCYGIVET